MDPTHAACERHLACCTGLSRGCVARSGARPRPAPIRHWNDNRPAETARPSEGERAQTTRPSWRSISSPDPERLAEERRLFYVATTRAKDRLQITHVAERGRRETGGPSRFLAEAGLDQAPSLLAA